jgi:hypothetical protein
LEESSRALDVVKGKSPYRPAAPSTYGANTGLMLLLCVQAHRHEAEAGFLGKGIAFFFEE